MSVKKFISRRREAGNMKSMKFEDMGLSPEIQRAVKEMNYTQATQIQAKAIPYIMLGRDLTGNSFTGSGKTAAFVIPALEKTDRTEKLPQVLVLCPTRELALQITEDIKKLSRYLHGIKTLTVYGGEPIVRQIRGLKEKPQFIVGTPGRVMDHMRRKTLDLSKVRMLVLDEADEMLNMGFREDIETIIDDIPQDRQTLLFSATIPKGILEITAKYLKKPKHIKIGKEIAAAPDIEECYFEINRDLKCELLTRLVQIEDPERAIVFCNTKAMTETVASKLKSEGIKAEPIHGDIAQVFRTDIMKRFKNGQFTILVATDVAARGIDVDDLEIVFNYDIPIDKEYYTHRIGRTARAGKEGKAYTFVSGPAQIKELNEIMKYTKAHIKKRKNPSYKEIHKKKIEGMLDSINTKTIANQAEIYKRAILERFGDDYSHLDIATALLQAAIEVGADAKNEKRFPSNEMDTTRIHINIGKRDFPDERNLIDLLLKNIDIDRHELGKPELFRNFSYINIPKSIERKIIDSLGKEYFNGKKVRVEPALKR